MRGQDSHGPQRASFYKVTALDAHPRQAAPEWPNRRITMRTPERSSNTWVRSDHRGRQLEVSFAPLRSSGIIMAVEHRAIRRRQIQRRPPDAIARHSRIGGEPGARRATVTPGDHVEQLPGVAHQRSAWTTPGSGSGRRARTSVSSNPTASTVAVTVAGHQSAACRRPRPRPYRVPVAAELSSDLGDGATLTADLARRPPRRPGGQRATGRRRSCGFCSVHVADRARPVRAPPPLLAPTPAAPHDRTPADPPAPRRGDRDHERPHRNPGTSAVPSASSRRSAAIVATHRHRPRPRRTARRAARTCA